MNSLITGGTGFIGTALAKRLVKEDNKIIILARGKKELEESLKNKIQIYRIDISEPTSLERLHSLTENVETLFQVAACIDYKASKEKLFQTNVDGTLCLLNFAVKHGIKKFVYISSIEAMGPVAKDQVPADESYPCQPVNFYGESKLEAEKLVTKFGNEGKIDTVILRLGNVYGPQSLSFILPISTAILNKDKRWLFSCQDLYRWHPVYIDDVVDGIIKAATKKEVNDVYILTGTEWITVKVLTQLIAQKLGLDTRTLELNGFKKICLNLRNRISRLCSYFMNRENARIHWAYSIEKAKKELNYSPKVSLSEGIERTIKWAKERKLL